VLLRSGVPILESLEITSETVGNVVVSRAIKDVQSGVKQGESISRPLEAHKVFWLNSSKCPAQWARQDWQKQQEENLCYVAATRAKAELVLIEEKRAA